MNKLSKNTCDVCGAKETEALLKEIIDKNGAKCYCTNCLIEKAHSGNLVFKADENLICDITNEKGAIIFRNSREEIALNVDTMKRFICHNLQPDEYFKVRDFYESHNMNDFMIHDDFYDAEGKALQPIE